MCAQYVFKLINIIDTVTNIFAWHQAVVFVVTKAIVFAHWYQSALRKSMCWPSCFGCERRMIVIGTSVSVLAFYIIIFVILLPMRFILVEHLRVDLTRHLLYACSKFVVGIIVHVNIYAFYQWQVLSSQRQQTFLLHRRQHRRHERFALSEISSRNSGYVSAPDGTPVNEYSMALEAKQSLPANLP